MLNIAERLSLLLEDVEPINVLDDVAALADEVKEAEQKVREANKRLQHTLDRLNADLATRIRQVLPGLSIALQHHSCKIGYKSKNLTITPNVRTGMWEFSSTDQRFAARFQRAIGSKAELSNLDGLTGSIVSYFRQYYKTLGEAIVGQGTILIEGRISTQLGLISRRSNLPYDRT